MKYYIQFPITKTCNLQCSYCFHKNFHEKSGPYENNKTFDLGFTLQEWNHWRDKFLHNAEEILINLAGGEPFNEVNSQLILDLMETSKNSMQTYEFLTNGLFDKQYISEIICRFKDKIKEIGFTFHRTCINEKQKEKFIENVLFVKSLGVNVFVKELLIVEYTKEIIENCLWWWKTHDVLSKIQDFKGDQGNGYDKYNEFHRMILSPEFTHDIRVPCTCKEGYKQIQIFGYDESAGYVTPCWRNVVIVGNISKMWFNPNYYVSRNMNGEKLIKGVPNLYYDHKTDSLGYKDEIY